MVQIIVSILIFTPILFSKTVVGKQKRRPNYVGCSSQSCEAMNLHYSNLMNAKKALEIQLQKKGQGIKPPAPISQQERLWNAQQSQVYQFVCEFNFDRANTAERKAFLKFARDCHEIMGDGLSRLEMAQCFYEISQSHKMTFSQLIDQLGGEKTFNGILSQGKPSMDF